MEKFYTVFGIKFKSELDCPELPQTTREIEQWDADIRFGEVPDVLENATHTQARYQAAPKQFLLKVDGVAKYLIENGQTITIEPDQEHTIQPDNEISAILLFLYGSAFGALIFQRGLLPLHAAAIATENGGVAFMGASGAGKSTLTAALQSRGYSILTDEICALEIKGNTILIHPGYPYIKLWDNTLKSFGLDKQALKRVRPEIQKYTQSIKDSFAQEAVPLTSLYVIGKHDTDNIETEELTGENKIQALIHNTYRSAWIEGMGIQASHFFDVKKITDCTKVTRIKRPDVKTLDRLDDFCDLLEAEMSV